MRTRTWRQIVVIAAVTVAAAGFGVMQSPGTPQGIEAGLLSGGLMGLVITPVEILVRDVYARPLRVIPSPVMFVLRTAFYGICFVAIPGGTLWAFHRFGADLSEAAVLSGASLLRSFGFAFAVNFVMAMRRMLGVRRMIALALGRYHRPREEVRVVAFMDLKGSTALAERLGAARYHDFLNEVLFDVAAPILEHGGEVYQYVGDEIVVTWPPGRGIKKAACVAFVFAVEDTLRRRHPAYQADYGATPSLRGALHIGPLMVGEIGDLNRQIVMIGDTMNTTARIEGACRKFSRDYVASAVLLDRIAELPPDIVKESLGPVPLAGKSGEMELFALKRR